MSEPIWPTDSICHDDGANDLSIFHSARCGSRYKITGSAMRALQEINTDGRLLLTEFIRRKQSSEPVWIDTETLEQASLISPPTVNERIERGIETLVECCPEIGKRYGIGEGDPKSVTARENLMGATFSKSNEEIQTYLNEYEQAGYLKISDNKSGNIARVRLTLKCHQFGDDREFNSQRAFVAMWFSDSMKGVFEDGIEPAVRACGYRAIRIDKKEHNNKIDDEIVAEIRRSKFLIADFTSERDKPRGGVYYEAGFAQGLGLPVVWTCREDLIDQVHFDTRQFNHITWSDLEELQTKLTNRIQATIGQGPLDV
ncbi:MAG: hypothetical protein AAF768_04110 [Pseudomonadota bacterium]